MADSKITKQALASALKDLMEETPFEKINIGHICEKCGMNRKSFYYHFRDKYDLVNWIFDTDFIALALNQLNHSADRWELIEVFCNYFYENRNFYHKALLIKGQNSFPEHFREFLHPLIHTRIEEILDQKDVPQLFVDFLTDGIVCAIERWLLDKDCMPPNQFVSTIKVMVESVAAEIYNDMSKTE